MSVPKGSQFFGEASISEVLKEGIDAVGAARMSRNARYLANCETLVAHSVFLNSIPYSRVILTDGIGLDGRGSTRCRFHSRRRGST
jgi:hypothetical protein